MTLGTIRATKFRNFVHRLWERLTFQPPRVHNYTDYQNGVDYVFEPASQGTQGYMTGQGLGIQAGDRILLKLDDMPQCYEVKSIDYYSSPSTMWTALLTRIH